MKMTRAMPTPFQTSTNATESKRDLRVGQPGRPDSPEQLEGLVDQPV